MKPLIVGMLTLIFTVHARATETRSLPSSGFVVLNDIGSQELNLIFNYRAFWDNSVCGFSVIRAEEDLSNHNVPLKSALNDITMTGRTQLISSMIPHSDQIVFKVTDDDRTTGNFTLKTKTGTIKDFVSKVLVSPTDQVIIMFSRNCVGMP